VVLIFYEDVDVGILVCKTVWTEALKIAAVCSSETLISTCNFPWRYNPEDRYRHQNAVYMKNYQLNGRQYVN
jgi:rRNA maturation protein Nop10